MYGRLRSSLRQYQGCLIALLIGLAVVSAPFVLAYGLLTRPGRILASVDGKAWSPASVRANLRGVTFGGGRFVAVGDNGVVLTSADGLRWHRHRAPVHATLSAIAYGAGRYVAVGDGLILSSADGIHWETDYQKGQLQFEAVAYGGDRWVAVGDRVEATSADGRAWTFGDGAFHLQSAAYGAGRFVAVGAGGVGPYVVVSADGSRWTSVRTVPERTWFHSVTYDGRQFLAMSSSSVGVSADGTTWLTHTSAAARGGSAVAHGDGRFVSVGPGGADTSVDGVTWEASQVADSDILTSVAYGAGRFVAVGLYQPIA